MASTSERQDRARGRTRRGRFERQPAVRLGLRISVSPARHGLSSDTSPWPQQGRASGDVTRTRLREGIYRRTLALADAAVAAVVVLVVLPLVAHPAPLAALAAVPLLVLVDKVVGLYDRDELVMSKRTLDEAPVLVQIAGLFSLLLWLVLDAWSAIELDAIRRRRPVDRDERAPAPRARVRPRGGARARRYGAGAGRRRAGEHRRRVARSWRAPGSTRPSSPRSSSAPSRRPTSPAPCAPACASTTCSA